MKTAEKIYYGKKENNYLDLYIPDTDTAPVFIYLHGGGLEGGSLKDDSVVGIANALAKRGIAVVCGEYSMYPNAKFPDFIKDGAAIVNWVKQNIDQYIKSTHIIVGGLSAGAYITQMLCFDEKYLAEYGISNNDIAGYFHDAGQPTTHFNVLRERKMDEKRIVVDDAAPIYHIDGTKKYPPMQFVVADNDMPNRYEQTMLIMSVLKNFDYDMEKIKCTVKHGYEHCEYTHETNDNGEFIHTDDIYEFIRRCID